MAWQEVFLRYLGLRRRQDKLSDDLRELQMKFPYGAQYGEKTGRSAQSYPPFAREYEHIVAEQAKATAELSELGPQVFSALRSLPKTSWHIVLYQRYNNGLTMRAIMRKVGYSIGGTQRLHDAAFEWLDANSPPKDLTK
ncbi:MAG: hypothetical protein LBQ80_02015 [Clostridium sp.]|jgi:hypothetical protein|nr:hypothetical protein [Clostridium sp.]